MKRKQRAQMAWDEEMGVEHAEIAAAPSEKKSDPGHGIGVKTEDQETKEIKNVPETGR